ncbi:ribbon-helix-helix domain-containing protein [Calothrix sp. CCY 0018]
MKKKQTPVYLDSHEKEKLTKLAADWGVSQSAAMKRLIREYKAG